MRFINEFIHNRFLICAIISWSSAQIIKALLFLIYNRMFNWERVWGAGGMPSSHAATVSSLAISSGIFYGFDSFQFAFAGILAIVVMYDACGVRRAAGEHARLINEMGDMLFSDSLTPQEKLKEFIGHTPLQVLVGAVLGCIIAFFMF